jgi:AcrR family transcriptional regulator
MPDRRQGHVHHRGVEKDPARSRSAHASTAPGLLTARVIAFALQAIADEAGVAVQTLYFPFGTKRGLLSEILDVAVAGDDEPAPTLERRAALAALADPDPRRQLRTQVRLAREIYERVAPVLQVVASAASADPDIAELWEINNTERATVQERLITALTTKGPLREGLDTIAAIDIALALQTPEMYEYLTRRRGWSPERWEHWTADALISELLPHR